MATWIAAYIRAKVAPTDAAALLVASRILSMRDDERYLSPGQLASILLPRPTRTIRSVGQLLSLAIFVFAMLTKWWLLVPAVLFGRVARIVTGQLYANRSLDHNCFWISDDLEKRRDQAVLKGDAGKVEAADNLLVDVKTVWLDAQIEDELVPERAELASQIGYRRSI